MPTPQQYAKQWKELKRQHKQQVDYEKETIEQFKNGTYQHPDHLTLQGITEKDIKRKLGID